jgi:hypothetical protein
MFGTTVHAVSRDKSVSIKLAENMRFDPTDRMDSKLKEGYLFRSPNLDPILLPRVFESLNMIAGPVNIWLEQDKASEKITGYAVVQEKTDAGMFAFANVEHWQKWSNVLEAEARADAKRKPQKVKVNKDGTIRVTVTATTLGD